MRTCGERSGLAAARADRRARQLGAGLEPCCSGKHPVCVPHGLRWRDLPQELGYGSGVTCWRRLRRRQPLGLWAAVHRTRLNCLGDFRAIDWTRASVDSTSVRAKRGGEHAGPNPVAHPSGLLAQSDDVTRMIEVVRLARRLAH
jgi:hypothetical protein